MKKRVYHRRRWLAIFGAIGVLGMVSLLTIAAFVYAQFFPHRYVVKPDTSVAKHIPPGAPLPNTIPYEPSTIKINASTVHVPILLYHYVEVNQDVRDTDRTKMAVTPYWFEKQLQYLRDNDYTTITFDQLYQAINGANHLPAKPVILTFDDGYRDFYTDAWPLLKKYQARATAFIVAGFLDKPNYMYSWQLSEIATDSAHLVTIGAHTLHHVALPSVSKARATEEITKSKSTLEAQFHQPVTVFAYPYGSFDKEVEDEVKAAGFQMAATTLFAATEGPDNLFLLPRIRVGNYTGKAFAARLSVSP